MTSSLSTSQDKTLDIEILLRTKSSFAELLENLSSILKIGFEVSTNTQARSNLATGYTCDIEIAVYDNPEFEQDKGMPLDEYSLVVNLIKLRSGLGLDTYNSFFVSLAKYLAERLSINFECEVRVTLDLQATLCVFGSLERAPSDIPDRG